MWSFDEHKYLWFKNEKEIHTHSKNYEKSGNGIDLDVLISCVNCVFHILGNLLEEGRLEKVAI